MPGAAPVRWPLRRRAGWIALAPILLVFAVGAPKAQTPPNEWSFEVLEVRQIDARSHVIRLRPVPPGAHFPRSCETLVIYSIFDLEEWTRAGRAMVSWSTHERSIRHLEQRLALNAIVRLAVVGRGFGVKSEETKCEVTSRAFSVVPDPGGDSVVFSFYEDPRAGSELLP